MIIFAGVLAVRAGRDLRIVGIALIVVVVLEFSLGIASILAGLPIVGAVAHNWLAAVLLLATLKLICGKSGGFWLSLLAANRRYYFTDKPERIPQDYPDTEH